MMKVALNPLLYSKYVNNGITEILLEIMTLVSSDNIIGSDNLFTFKGMQFV
jgi:hypothetical protein